MMLGMPSLIEAPSLIDCFSIAKRLGLDFVELNMNLPEHQPEAVDVVLAQRLMQETGIRLTLHLSEAMDPCDFDPRVRGAYLHTALLSIQLARELGCPLVNLHMAKGVYFTLPDRKIYLYEQYRDHYLSALRAFRDACVEAIGDSSMRVCVENCGEFLPFQREGLLMLLESPRFGLTFDVGHDFPGRKDEAFILEHRDRLHHVHLHDGSGDGKRSHLALGDGEIDMARMLGIARDCDCSVVVETKTLAALESSVKTLRKRL